ncbi:hypothetical protein ASG30_05765 [Ramlibacter sp. Leaf400]|nr:hypothetical protein ASG30_05765 [Ramlibacter sp. Leaf400]
MSEASEAVIEPAIECPGGNVHEDRRMVALRGLRRPQLHLPFDPSKAIVFRRVHSHIGRVGALCADLRREQLSRGLAGAALDALQFPVFAIDRAGTLLMANSAGDRSLREGSPLAIRQDRLHSPDPAIAARLEGALRAAASQRGSAFSATVRATLWLLRVVPLQEPCGAALVYANTPDADPVRSRTLASLLRFTQAEADVACMLADGLSPKEIAFERDVSLHTIRTQVRGIFEKAGVRRQADLTRLLLSVPPIHGEPV